MARFDMDRWLDDADKIGARFASSDLRGGLGFGLFSPDRMKVPEGVKALVKYEDGSSRLIGAGEDAVGSFRAVVVKTHAVPLSFRIEEVLSADGYPFVFTAVAEVTADCADASSMKDFTGAFVGRDGAADRREVLAALLPEAEEEVRNYVASRTAEALTRGDRSSEIEARWREVLKKTLFESGLVLEEVHSVRFESEAFDRVLEDKIEATVEGERAHRLQIIREAWLKDQKEELLSNREVQDLMRALEHEGALKEIERRKEKILAEKELQRLAQEASEERLADEARRASNLMKVLEEAGFKNVLDKYMEIARPGMKGASAPGTGLDPELHGVEAGRTERLLCAAGKRLLSWTPGESALAPYRSFQAESLGMLRSVSMCRRGGTTRVAAGAQHGVYLVEAGAPTRSFAIPGAGKQRGGVNAACLFGDALFASHSDFGLVRWRLGDGEEGATEGEIVRPDLTGGKSTCRGVQIGPLDRLLFAAGEEAISLLPESLDGTPTLFQGSGDAITALVSTERSLFAGTAGGDVLRWEFTLPDADPVREIARRPDPVFMLKTCAIGGRPHLLAAWKSYAVLAKALESDTEVSYPSEARIRWTDGADDYLYGVDREGRRLYLWEAGNPRAKPMVLRSQERIQDLAVQRKGDEAAGEVL